MPALLLIVVSIIPLQATSLREAENILRLRENSAQVEKALEILTTLAQKRPNDPELQWRLAFAGYSAGVLAKDTDKKADFFREASEIGNRASLEHPQCAPCHFWAAINRAAYGEQIGALKILFSLPKVRDQLHRVVELDPTYAHAGALRILALIDSKLPRILGGDVDRAVFYLKRAIRLTPHSPINYLVLAKILEKESPQEARQVVQEGIERTRSESLDCPEARESFSELRAWPLTLIAKSDSNS